MHPKATPKGYLPQPGQILTANRRDDVTRQFTTHQFKIDKYFTEQGMRGILARAHLLDHSRTNVVVKFPNLDETRSPYDISGRIDKFQRDVKRELDAWDRLHASAAKNHIAAVYGLGAYDSGRRNIDMRYAIPYFVQEYVDGLQLDKWCERRFGNPFQGIKDAHEWFQLSRKLVEILGWIHQERVVHADLWQPNIMIRFSDLEPVFVDFGQAWRLDWMMNAPSEGSTPYPYYAPERLGISEGPWYQPADIYSICGILHYLASGSHPPQTYELTNDAGRKVIEHASKTETKKEIVRAISEKNRELYEANLGIPDIILYGLRPKAHERATYAEELLEVMDYYRDAFQRDDHKPKRIHKSKNLSKTFQAACSKFEGNEIHHRILKRSLHYVQTQIDSIFADQTDIHLEGSQLYNIRGGDRDELVKYLLAAFSGLRRGDQILAQTTPIFWRKKNFGANGRFLTILKMAAVKGITIRWVLLIEKDKQWSERNEDEGGKGLSRILEAQKGAVEEARRIANIDIESKSLAGPGFFVGYHLITEEQRKTIVMESKTFIVLNEKGGDGQDKWTAITPTYTERNGHIAHVRLWRNPKRWEHDWLASFKANLESSTNILEYVPS